MRKVELTEAEAAAVIRAVSEKIVEAAEQVQVLKNGLRYAKKPAKEDVEALDYWKNTKSILQQALAKLEREETEGDDAVHQTEN